MSTRIYGEGDLPSRLMLVGESPNEAEIAAGRPLIGQVGDELNRYLFAAGLSRHEFYITTLIKGRIAGDVITVEEIMDDAGELREEIATCEPQIIATLGRTATRHFLGNVNLKDVHGLAFSIIEEETGLPLTVVPIHHPSAGLYSAGQQSLIQYDFHQLAGVVRGRISSRPLYAADEIEPTYADVTRVNAIYPGPLLQYTINTPFAAVDTEGLPGSPWGLSFSYGEGKAEVIRANMAGILKINPRTTTVILHNALWDIPILREMGIEVPKYVDTMIAAYLLCIEPRGLKPLAFRHAGMEMKSFATTVLLETDDRIAREYLESIFEELGCRACAYTGKVVKPKLVKCKTCKGTGGGCPDCGEVGKIAVARKDDKLVYEKCPSCLGEGTIIPPPSAQLIWEGLTSSIYQPQSIGKRVRRILADTTPDEDNEEDDTDTSGADDKKLPIAVVRKRWMKINEEVRESVEMVLGPMPLTTLDDIDPVVAVDYAAKDADATFRIYPKLMAMLEERNLMGVFEMDCGILPMLDRMTSIGIEIDVDYFHKLDAQLETENDQLLRDLKDIIGHEINPESPKQCEQLLFHDLGMPGIKLTKSKKGESTDDKVLETLKLKFSPTSRQGRILELLTAHRERDKLRGSFSGKLPKMIDKKNRIHTRFKTTRADTGRLASADPNLQNIPARTELGKLIRQGFIAGDGKLLIAIDYAQIEMVVLAHESQDDNLCQVFIDRLDLHAMTAALSYRIPLEMVTKAQRTLAKNIGFGIVYGITARGLQAQMSQRGLIFTLDECQAMIDQYLHELYPGVGKYMNECARRAKRDGFITDMFGRIRYMAAARSTNERLAAEAIRQAGNMPIQGGAAGIMKKAMIIVWNETLPELWEDQIEIEPILPVHDELIFEVEQYAAEYAIEKIIGAMERAHELIVPLRAEGKAAKNWGLLK